MGARRIDIGTQFGVESMVVSVIALVLAILLIAVGLQPFNSFVDKDITIGNMGLINIGLFITGLTLMVGLIAGCYPSIYLSSLNSIAAIKDSKRKLNAGFTRVLVVFQFSLSIFLLVCSMFMYRQMEFLTTKDLGFDKENVLVVPTQQAWGVESDRFVDRFRTELEMNPDIVAIGGTSTPFSQGWSRHSYVIDEVTYTSFNYRVDAGYIHALKIDMIEGRNFITGSSADSNAIIVNQALVKDMGWEQPLMEVLEASDPPMRVIGVVEDHHFLSLEAEIQPMVLSLKNGFLQNMYVRVKPAALPGVIDDIRSAWAKIEADKPFEFTFLDSDLARQYDTYERWSRIMLFATILAVFIACLGLFGLAGVTTANKTKEIGIRKVLGASIPDILVLVNRPYAIMMILAYIFAIPAAYYVVQRWLENFEYAITMEWWIMIASFAVCILLAIGTVSYHAFRASQTNPVNTLKYE
jgi:putative ABC transport system permease protein